MRPVSDENASVCDRNGPGKGFPQPGGDFALTGRQGRLRACMKDVQRFFLPHFFSGSELSTAESWGPLWGSDSVVDNCT
ncbi:hypothetical protein BU765_20010 [Salmonella enterica]|nr:hypothetical protein [Salmonella enterica]ECO0980116.1 hypothetical protein [Salmonella enterica subsp. enterica serovar Muenchen]EBB1780125.1 hypothetical protein [Salmonella enterica]EBQ6683600.1 hypothetical protein [Salmonella enterica]ECE0344605.1 hypothetical protein [Salmonella enterica]